MLGLLVEDEQMGGNHPDIAVFVHIYVISLIGIATIVFHVAVLPHHLSLLAVEGHHLTVAGNDKHLLTIIAKRGQPELLRDFVLAIAIFDQRQILGLGIQAIHTLIVGLHPKTFLGVDVKTVDTALDTHLRQFCRRIAVDALCHRIEDTEVHTLPQPEATLMVFPDQIHIVVAQRGRIIRIVIIGTKTVAIITVQTI